MNSTSCKSLGWTARTSLNRSTIQWFHYLNPNPTRFARFHQRESRRTTQRTFRTVRTKWKQRRLAYRVFCRVFYRVVYRVANRVIYSVAYRVTHRVAYGVAYGVFHRTTQNRPQSSSQRNMLKRRWSQAFDCTQLVARPRLFGKRVARRLRTISNGDSRGSADFAWILSWILSSISSGLSNAKENAV